MNDDAAEVVLDVNLCGLDYRLEFEGVALVASRLVVQDVDRTLHLRRLALFRPVTAGALVAK